jgi:hypothetical protein
MTTPSVCLADTAWPRERVRVSLAGTATPLSAALLPWFLLMTTGPGLNQLLLVATGRRPASLVVDRLSARRAS